MTPETLIARRAARQHGLVSYQQMVSDGLTRHEIAQRVRVGLLHPKYRGVFAVGHPELTPEGHWMAAVLAYGDDSALSNASGAALWEVRPSASALIDVSVTSRAGRSKRAGIRPHRPPTLDASQITTHRGIRVTTLERTLLDIAATLARPALQRALERAEILRLLDVRALHATIDAHPHHRGRPSLAAALELYRDDEMTRSDLEAFFRDLCAEHDLPRPRVNAILDGDAKDARLTIAGYRVVRLTHRQIEHRRDATAATVIALLRAASPARA